jgi:coniferyl-aldehyde dehydrogenase
VKSYTTARDNRIMHGLQARLNAQRAAFRKRSPGFEERKGALRRLEQSLLKHKSDIIDAISQDFGGRAAEETLTLELFPVLNEIRHAVRHLRSWMEPCRTPVSWQFWPGRAKVIYRALGVVGIISPWNYPVFLSLGPLVGALAAGNHCMLKPSEFAPATSQLTHALIAELYPAEYVSVELGGVDTAAEFANLPFDHLLFTGSTRVGKLVMKAASENLTPVTLELGGKSPALIHPSYPLGRAARRIAMGKLYNAGQTCVAPDYLLLPLEHKAEFLSETRRAVESLYPRLVDSRDYTRILTGQHYQRLAGLVEDARQKGAEVMQINPAQEDCNAANRVFPPTLLWNIGDNMRVMQDEIFGPVLPIVLYRDLEEAIGYLNDRPHPLALYYFDHSGGRIRHVLRETVAGGVTVNDCIFHVGQSNLPFGGVGPSGMGRYHGFSGFETFSQKQGVFVQGRWSPLSLLRPPYGQRARWILRFLVGA